jgi:hypothetical protein
MGAAFVVGYAVLRPRIPVRLAALAFGVAIWSCLMGTIVAAPHGEAMLFRLTPLTVGLSLAGHLIYGFTIGTLYPYFFREGAGRDPDGAHGAGWRAAEHAMARHLHQSPAASADRGRAARAERLLPRALESWNPRQCLVCVIDDPVALQQAVVALYDAGFAAVDVQLVPARVFLELEEAQRARSLLACLLASFRALGDEGLIAAHYLAAARRGQQVLIVHAPGEARMRCAQAIVVRAHAHTLHYYGRWVIQGIPSLGGTGAAA